MKRDLEHALRLYNAHVRNRFSCHMYPLGWVASIRSCVSNLVAEETETFGFQILGGLLVS